MREAKFSNMIEEHKASMSQLMQESYNSATKVIQMVMEEVSVESVM